MAVACSLLLRSVVIEPDNIQARGYMAYAMCILCLFSTLVYRMYLSLFFCPDDATVMVVIASAGMVIVASAAGFVRCAAPGTFSAPACAVRACLPGTAVRDDQRFFFSRNISSFTLIFFHLRYLKKYILAQRIQKTLYFILKTAALVMTILHPI